MQIAEIRERLERATPGPWMWNVNEHSKIMHLLTKHSGQYYVMGFDRWGMNGAQPTFQKYDRYEGDVHDRGSRGMYKAIELSKWAQDYRHNDGWIDHPDAELIAHAPTDITFLLSEVERLEKKISKLDLQVLRLKRELNEYEEEPTI